MSLLSPNKIYLDFKNNIIEKGQALSLLLSLIDDIHDYDDKTRILGLKYLGLMKSNEDCIFSFLENLLISDINENIRGHAAKILILNFPEKAFKPIRWTLKYDKSDFCRVQIIKAISKVSQSDLKRALDFIQYVNFDGNIFFPSRFYPNLNLNNRGIDDIRKIRNLERLTNLKKLYLNYNQITEIKGLDNLKKLNSLHLQGNMIKKIEGLSDLKKLESLYLNNNEIYIIEGITDLSSLKLLMLFDNKITHIRELDNLSNLEVLNLRNNQITEIDGLRKLTNLKRLDLCNNQITEIKGLENLRNLEFLDLSHNNIIEVKDLENLKKLKFLDLRNNKICRIKGLEKLPKLQHLYIGFNNISKIENLDLFKHVKVMDIKNTEDIFFHETKQNTNSIKIDRFEDVDKIKAKIKEIKFLPEKLELQSVIKELSHINDLIEHLSSSSWLIILKNNKYQIFKLSNSGKITWI